MKKTYIKPASNQFCFIEPLTPLCESGDKQNFKFGGSTETTDASWSNKKENPVWGGQSKGPWGE